MKTRVLGWDLAVVWRAFPVLAVVISSAAATPRLDFPTVTGNRISLGLRGDAGQSYRIERSVDLKTWTTLISGVAVNGWLSATDTVEAGGGPRFYRGLVAGATQPFPTVSFGSSSRYQSSGLVTPEAGGAVFLGLPDGVQYGIEFSTNAVFDATMVTLTLVTNLTGLPTAAGAMTAVRLEPAGLVLAAPTFLSIEFPTNIPAAQISSFAFDNNGANLHLVPDVVVTNRVRILVNQLRGYGSGVFTEAEVTELGATVPPAARSRPSRHATMEECYPEDEEAAKEMREELENKIRPLQQEIAEKLSLERQRQLLGVADEGEGVQAIGEAMSTGETFYQNEIVPKVSTATQRCATTRELLTWMLGWERQKQLLGTASDDDPGATEISQTMCAGFRKCQEQAIECCRTKGGDTRLIAFLLGLERQRQLLGIEDGSCGQSMDVEGLIDDCAPKWWGTLKVTEEGSYSTNRSSSSAIDTDREQWKVLFEGTVAAVEETIFEQVLFVPAHTNLTFTVVGPLTGSYQRERYYKDLFDPCGGSQRALARVRPHDGGEALENHAIVNASTNLPVSFEVRATLLPPGTGALGINPRLNFAIPYADVKNTGWIKYVMKAVSGSGCETEDSSGPPSGSQAFGGVFIERGSGGFQYTADTIKFLRITPRQVGNMVVVQRVELNFRRLK